MDFAVIIAGVVEVLPNSRREPIDTVWRWSAPNYGEAQSAESRKDFIQKLKIAIKELRETMVWLKITARNGMASRDEKQSAIKECNELIAIFVSITKTADSHSK